MLKFNGYVMMLNSGAYSPRICLDFIFDTDTELTFIWSDC